MIENRQSGLVESVVGAEDAEEVGHNRIGGRGLAEVPRNCRSVVTSQGRCLPGTVVTYGARDGHLEDRIHQLKVQVSDGAFWIGESDQLLDDVCWPLDVPGVVLVILIWVYLDLPQRPGPKH